MKGAAKRHYRGEKLGSLKEELFIVKNGCF